ncbi:MAG TPA: phosphatidylserine decarboxylase family protein [Bacteroidales bacterium]|nr:phosphatidylserine decarboxylase family protein [Bacteroidales bacterium]HSA42889.1 phosphatidylserine decarboxylase family protein [Bacteroidales bacterium]
MKIHKEGYFLILVFFCIFLGLVVVVEVLSEHRTWLNYLFYAACLVGMIFLVAFFRSPLRQISREKDLILAPADGRVVVVEKIFESQFFNEERIQVSIFMSPFNVHANWYPVSGTVTRYIYHPGRYLVAWHPKSSQSNERTSIIIRHENKHHVLIRQIAGAVARRIVCYADVDKQVSQGDELGFIKFGSRVDLILPKDTQILVELNQKVRGKLTPVGRFSA